MHFLFKFFVILLPIYFLIPHFLPIPLFALIPEDVEQSVFHLGTNGRVVIASIQASTLVEHSLLHLVKAVDVILEHPDGEVHQGVLEVPAVVGHGQGVACVPCLPVPNLVLLIDLLIDRVEERMAGGVLAVLAELVCIEDFAIDKRLEQLRDLGVLLAVEDRGDGLDNRVQSLQIDDTLGNDTHDQVLWDGNPVSHQAGYKCVDKVLDKVTKHLLVTLPVRLVQKSKVTEAVYGVKAEVVIGDGGEEHIRGNVSHLGVWGLELRVES